jgi:hypothetical protein
MTDKHHQSEPHDRLRRVSRALAQARLRTEEAKGRNDRKSARRQKKADVAPTRGRVSEKPDRATKAVNARTVQTWFREAHWKRMGSRVIVSGWTIPQETLAKRLLDHYGNDLMYEAVQCFFEHYDAFSSHQRGKIWNEPTINLLWAIREQVFLQVQREQLQRLKPEGTAVERTEAVVEQPRDPKNSDEYRPMKVRSRLGWHD